MYYSYVWSSELRVRCESSLLVRAEPESVQLGNRHSYSYSYSYSSAVQSDINLHHT